MEDLAISKILQTMPHRYPFLLIDRIIEYTPFESIKALKNVSINEPYFQGHFPGHPIMPGVLILESMAQATGMLAFYSNQTRNEKGNVYYLVGIGSSRTSASCAVSSTPTPASPICSPPRRTFRRLFKKINIGNR